MTEAALEPHSQKGEMLSSVELRAKTAEEIVAVRPAAPTFAEIYEQEFSFVWRSARSLGVVAHALDDVTQEVFVVVHRRLGDFEGRSSVRTWVYGIVRNVVRAHRRGVAQEPKSPPGSELPVDPDSIVDPTARAPDEALEKREAAALLMKFLDAMDDDKREVFVLAELELFTVPEVATMIGENVNTVYSRLRLARAELSAAASRYGLHEQRRFT